MGFCYFCWREADKLKKKISQLEGEVKWMLVTIEHLKQLQRIQNTKKNSVPTFDQVFNNMPKSKNKLIKTVKEALLSRNMTENEANNLINLLLKENKA